MKDKLKDLILWKPDRRLVLLGMAALLVLTLFPLYRLAMYAIPWYDDYMFGRFTKAFLGEEYSLRSALAGAYYCAKTEWYAWQGCYSCSFLNSLVPNIWNEGLYWLGPVSIITLLAVSVFLLTKTLLRNVLGKDPVTELSFSCAVSVMVVMLIHTAQAGFYWYVGGMSYVAMHSFLLLLAAVWIRLLAGSGRVRAVLLILCSLAGAVLVGGANYVTGLQGMLLGLSLCGLGILLKRKRTLTMLPSVLLYAYCFYKSVSAPGNSVRSNIYDAVGGYGMDPLSAIGCSFLEAFRRLGEFTGLITLAIIVTLLPLIRKLIRDTKFRFPYPALILLWSFCFYAAGFAPGMYALGHGGLGRTLNAVKITYQVLLMANVVYWLGWFNRKRKEKGILKAFDKGAPFLFYLFMGLLMLGIFKTEPNQAGSYSAYGAYYYIHTGEANEFHKEYLARMEKIVNGGPVVEVTPYHFRPWFLIADDLSDNPDSEPNRAIADWYGKEAVICISEDAERKDVD